MIGFSSVNVVLGSRGTVLEGEVFGEGRTEVGGMCRPASWATMFVVARLEIVRRRVRRRRLLKGLVVMLGCDGRAGIRL